MLSFFCKYKNWIYLLIVCVVCIIVGINAILTVKSELLDKETEIIILEAGDEIQSVYEGESILQTFISNSDGISKISFPLSESCSYVGDEQVHIKVVNNSEPESPLVDEIFYLTKIVEDSSLVVDFDVAPNNTIDNELMILMEPLNMGGKCIEYKKSQYDDPNIHLFYSISYKEQNYDIALSISTIDIRYSANTILLYLAFVLFVLIITIVGVYYFSVKDKAYEKIYLSAAIGLGIFIMLILPPYATPDECGHMSSVFDISNKIMGVEEIDTPKYIYMEKEVMEYGFLTTPSLDLYSNFIDKLNTQIFNSNEQYGKQIIAKFDVTPIQYLIPSLGVIIARLLNFNGIYIILAGRIANMLFMISMIYCAIKITPEHFKPVLLMVALTPVMLEIQISYSYDNFLYSVLFLFMALIIKLHESDKSLTKTDMIIIAVLAIILVQCKGAAYAPLAFLFLLIPKKCYKNKKSGYVYRSVISAILLIEASYFLIEGATGNATWQIWEGSYVYSDFIKNPLLLVKLLINTSVYSFPFIGIFDGYMGGKSISYLVPVAFYIIMFSVLLCEKSKLNFTNAEKCFIAMIMLCTIGELFVAAVSWTSVNVQYICPLHGRYFIFCLPLLGIILNNNIVRVNIKYPKMVMWTECLIYIVVFHSLMMSLIY